jgi:hypothetical protein
LYYFSNLYDYTPFSIWIINLDPTAVVHTS